MPGNHQEATDRAVLGRAFSEFARAERRRSPLYAAMADVVAVDPEIIALFDGTPRPQQRPVLLFAALHRLALEHPESDLATCFPTITRLDPDIERAVSVLATVCRRRGERLRSTLRHSTTQTNEVGRAAAVLAGLSYVARGVREPLALVELGASAGLLLCPDRYRIQFGAEHEAGPVDSTVIVRCDVRDRPPDPITGVDIAWRRGVDLDPVDLRDPERRAWLLACIWADDVERFDRLSAAMAVVAADPPPVEQGDAADRLPALLEAVPDHLHPVVLNSWALAYLSPERRRQIVGKLASIGSRRDLSWLSIESAIETPELPRPDDELRTAGATDLVVWTARAGRITVRRVAELHPHGRWMRWLG